MAVFFTSDTHFGHKNIIGFSNRPYADVTHMNEALIANWNGKVRPGDRVYHLGDFSFMSPQNTLDVIDRLNGEIHLVRGNHDARMHRTVLEQFASVNDIKELKIDNQSIVLCHYAMLVWNKSHYRSWMLHGHSHGTLPDDERALRIDVGVDAIGRWANIQPYAPIEFSEVKDIMDGKRWYPVDHHRG